MKCLILAAGFSTRLYPLTKDFPKGLLPMGDKLIIQNLLDPVLRLNSIDQYALITNQVCFSHYQKFLKSNPKYQKIKLISNEISKPEDRLGALGDILFALRTLKWDDDVLILPSDTLVSIKLSDLLAFYRRHPQITNVVKLLPNKEQIAKQLGCVEMQGNKIIDFEEKPAHPKSTLVSVPIYIYPRDSQSLILRYAEKGNNLDSPGSIIPWLLKQTKVLGYLIKNGYYFDVGTKQIYYQLKKNHQL